MEAKAVDLEELQSQIAAAESYLLESSRPTSRTHAEIIRESHDTFLKEDSNKEEKEQGFNSDYREPERSSQTFEPSITASLDRSISEREALVERLLMEHNRRKSLRVTSIDFGSVTASAEGIASEPAETSTSYFDNDSIQDSLDHSNSLNYASTVKFTRSLHAWEKEPSVSVSQPAPQHLPTTTTRTSKTENQPTGARRYRPRSASHSQSASRSRSRSRSQSRVSQQPETETDENDETDKEFTLRPPSSAQSQIRSYSRRKSNREMLLQAAEEDFQAKHPFHPVIHNKQQPKRREKGELVNRLYHLHSKQNREKELQKHAFDQLDLLECTFQPSIPHHHQGHRHKGAESEEVSQSRLYDDAMIRAQKLHLLSEEINSAKMSSYTFTPQLHTHRSFQTDDNRPIHERLADIQKQRQLRLQQLQTNFEQEKNNIFTFTPHLVTRPQQGSSQHADSREKDDIFEAVDTSNVANRLLLEGRKLLRKKQQLLQAHDDYLSMTMTPAQMSDGSKKLTKTLNSDFQSRQNQFQQQKRQHSIERKQALDEQENTLFKPKIISNPQFLGSSQKVNETAEERFHRLAIEDREKIIQTRKHLEQEIYGHTTFTPQIDPVSKLFGRKSSLQELYLNPRGKMAQTIAKITVEKEINDECTFQPKINETSRRIIEGYSEDFAAGDLYPPIVGYAQQPRQQQRQSQNETRLRRINLQEPEKMLLEIRNHAMEQEQHRREVMIAREIQELQECTFTPSLPPSRSPIDQEAEQPIVVRGLGRHLELKQMANHLQQEKSKREHAAFHVVKVDHFRRPEDGSTIVQPFVLSTAARAAQQEQQSKRHLEKKRLNIQEQQKQQHQQAHQIYH